MKGCSVLCMMQLSAVVYVRKRRKKKAAKLEPMYFFKLKLADETGHLEAYVISSCTMPQYSVLRMR